MNVKLIEQVCKFQVAGEKAALVTILGTKGSTPQKAGCQMLVSQDGRIYGTIGGGCSEAAAKIKALTALDQGRPQICTVDMLNSVASREGMACGGTMELFIQPI